MLGVLAAAALVTFDDGWMPMNGSVMSFSGKHPSVRMVSETVRATVHRDTSDVGCDFVFKNDGDACAVRMAFPAAGENDWDDAKDEVDQKVLSHFESTVDGKRVKTEHIVLDEGQDPQQNFEIRQWEVKTVPFARGATVHVHDQYQMPNGGSDVDADHRVRHFYYILATGGTWHGKIGRADVIVTLAKDAVPGTVKFVPESGLSDPNEKGSTKYARFFLRNRNAVSYFGPSRPKVSGRTITFTKSEWSPDEGDNIILTFGIEKDKE